MKLFIVFLATLFIHGAPGCTTTWGAATRIITADQIKSANLTKTFNFPSASDTLVGLVATQTLTNKTLSGNTATNLISGAGTITFNTSGTITVPNATDTLVGRNTTDTLTNKTISGASNTITNVSLTTGVTGVLPIANGGTNNGALAVTAGGTLYTDGSKIVNVGVGTTGQVLTSNGAGAPTWSAASASVTYTVQSKSANYTALVTDDIILCTGTFTITLYAASAWVKPLTVKNIGTGVITVARAGGDLVESATSIDISATNSVDLVSDLATNFWVK